MAEAVPDIPPVQLIVQTRQRWQQYVAGTMPPPPYAELLHAGLNDISMLAGHALGQVQEAYRAGRAMVEAQEQAHALMLHGLDILQTAVDAADMGMQAVDHLATGEADVEHARAVEAARATTLAAAVPVALEYRQRALSVLAAATAEAALALDAALDTQLQAATYVQGPEGVPPMLPPAPGL